MSGKFEINCIYYYRWKVIIFERPSKLIHKGLDVDYTETLSTDDLN